MTPTADDCWADIENKKHTCFKKFTLPTFSKSQNSHKVI